MSLVLPSSSSFHCRLFKGQAKCDLDRYRYSGCKCENLNERTTCTNCNASPDEIFAGCGHVTVIDGCIHSSYCPDNLLFIHICHL